MFFFVINATDWACYSPESLFSLSMPERLMPLLTSVFNNHLFALHLHTCLVITKVVTRSHLSHIPPTLAVVSQILEIPFFSSFSNFNYSFPSCLMAPTHFAVSNVACKRAALYDPPSCVIGTSPLNNFPETHRQGGDVTPVSG